MSGFSWPARVERTNASRLWKGSARPCVIASLCAPGANAYYRAASADSHNENVHTNGGRPTPGAQMHPGASTTRAS